MELVRRKGRTREDVEWTVQIHVVIVNICQRFIKSDYLPLVSFWDRWKSTFPEYRGRNGNRDKNEILAENLLTKSIRSQTVKCQGQKNSSK